MTNPHASAVQRAIYGDGPAQPVNLKPVRAKAVIKAAVDAADDRREKALAEARKARHLAEGLKALVAAMRSELLAWRSASSMGLFPNTPEAAVYLKRAKEAWAKGPALEHVPARDDQDGREQETTA